VRRGLSWSIVDTRSTNGTFVNDARADEAVLHADDRIRLVGQQPFAN
jgi:pSer/pThr/pTyr-binding forkhead associated (FHA) protein